CVTFIQDECIGHRADLQQPVPVGRVARQSRHLQSQDYSSPSHPHFRDQLLKTCALAISLPESLLPAPLPELGIAPSLTLLSRWDSIPIRADRTLHLLFSPDISCAIDTRYF